MGGREVGGAIDLVGCTRITAIDLGSSMPLGSVSLQGFRTVDQ